MKDCNGFEGMFPNVIMPQLCHTLCMKDFFAEEIWEHPTDCIPPPHIVGNLFVVLIMIEMFSADVESKFVE